MMNCSMFFQVLGSVAALLTGIISAFMLLDALDARSPYRGAAWAGLVAVAFAAFAGLNS